MRSGYANLSGIDGATLRDFGYGGYYWFLATGIRMNYAPYPDYGPYNGDKMVDYLIQKLG